MFSLVTIFITIVGLMIMGTTVLTTVGIFRHRSSMHRLMDDMLRHQQAKTAQPGTGDRPADSSDGPAVGNSAAGDAAEYRCQNCGAGLGAETEISPSGDFKCPYCRSWSNVRV